MKRTRGCVGVTCVAGDGVCSEQRLGTAVGGVGWGTLPWRRGTLFVICGMLRSMLLHVRLECICLVNFRKCFSVGFDAAMIMCVLDIQLSGGILTGCRLSTLCSTICSIDRVTLCSGGGTYGVCCRSPGGRSHV
jgi:hypothetical protein